jgi:PAB-dependent poly(A)-specific ribonuclease subunit 2
MGMVGETGHGWMQVGMAAVKHGSAITSIAFDVGSELLWVGNNSGSISAHHARDLRPRVILSAYPNAQPVLGLIPRESVLFSFSLREVRVHTLGGVLLKTFDMRGSLDEGATLVSMCFQGAQGQNFWLSSSSGQVMAMHGLYGNVLLHAKTAEELAEGAASTPTCMSFCPARKLLCVGTKDGYVELRSAKDMALEARHKCHAGRVARIHAKGDLLVTCGLRVDGQRDQFHRLVDLRLKKLVVTPIRGSGAADVSFLPNFTGSFVSMAPFGRLQTFDQSGMETALAQTVQMQTSYNKLECMAVSPTGAVMALGDDQGLVYLWNYVDPNGYVPSVHPFFNPLPEPSAFANPLVRLQEWQSTARIPVPPPPEALYATKPDSMKTTEEKFISIAFQSDHKTSRGGRRDNSRAVEGEFAAASEWKHPSAFRSFHQHNPIDTKLIPSARRDEFNALNLFLAPYPTNAKRNCYASSKKFRATDHTAKKKGIARQQQTFHGQHRARHADEQNARDDIPIAHAKAVVKIPKFGLQYIDFTKFNRSDGLVPGMSNFLPHSYVNSVIQLLYFIPPLRRQIADHLCLRESCVCCELSFLFHMMDSSKGKSCEPRNFLRILRQVPEASALGLLNYPEDEATDEVVLADKIQNFFRFLLEHLHKELREGSGEPPKRDEHKHHKHKRSHKRGKDRKQRRDSSSSSSSSSSTAAAHQKSIVSDLFGSRMQRVNMCQSAAHPGDVAETRVLYYKIARCWPCTAMSRTSCI